MPRLNLDALEVLDAIDRQGSFAAAAAALYRVPSAVTYTVQKLEEDLGLPVFRREGRRSVMTPAGRLLLEQGREILEAADRVVENARQVHAGWESRLSIALDSVLDTGEPLNLLSRFYDIQADTEIEIFEEVLGGSWEAVLEGRADLAVGASEAPPTAPDLMMTPWRELEWVFAVASGHPLASAEAPLGEADITVHRAVVVRDSSRSLPPLTRRVFDRQPVLRVANLQQKIAAQVAGLGVGYLPADRVAGLLESGVLVAPPLAAPIPPVQLYLVWRRGNRGRALRWFIEEFNRIENPGTA